MVYNWLDIIQECLFPPTCILCGNPGYRKRDLCRHCHDTLPLIEQCCLCCAEIFEKPMSDFGLCGRCISQRPAFDQVFAPYTYQQELSYLITSLKFGASHYNARLLGQLLAEHVKQCAPLPECIIPVPLYKTRYRERGFNQALEIGRQVSMDLSLPLNYISCTRTRDTPHQTGLSAKQRRKNLKDTFAVTRKINATHVAVLDDVMTTGTTVNEMARELKRAGVARVDVWVCARA